MDPNAKPIQENPRRVPIPVKDELKSKIEDLETKDVIVKVTKPTPWISNMVAVRKPNKLRLCLDPLHLNKGIVRNHYPKPTVEDIAPKLTKANVFSVVDAKDEFQQVVLDEPSSYLTTFWTPVGRFRWPRLPFGIKSAPEEFQRRLDECLEGLENIAVIHDDIVIFGSGVTTEEAIVSHDVAFKALLDRCRERALKLNKKKIKLQADQEKIQALENMPRSTDVHGLQRLIGVVTYLSKFLPRLSIVCETFCRLTDSNSVFDWSPQHEDAFVTIKELIIQAPVLRYF